jgi:hypothetical protein
MSIQQKGFLLVPVLGVLIVLLLVGLGKSPPRRTPEVVNSSGMRITRPFHLGKFEVTVGQFRRVTANAIGVRLLVIPDRKGAMR